MEIPDDKTGFEIDAIMKESDSFLMNSNSNSYSEENELKRRVPGSLPNFLVQSASMSYSTLEMSAIVIMLCVTLFIFVYTVTNRKKRNSVQLL